MMNSVNNINNYVVNSVIKVCSKIAYRLKITIKTA